MRVVATVNETMVALKVGRAKLYELLNANELESYLEGSSRKILWRSIDNYVDRRLAEQGTRQNAAIPGIAAFPLDEGSGP